MLLPDLRFKQAAHLAHRSLEYRWIHCPYHLKTALHDRKHHDCLIMRSSRKRECSSFPPIVKKLLHPCKGIRHQPPGLFLHRLRQGREIRFQGTAQADRFAVGEVVVVDLEKAVELFPVAHGCRFLPGAPPFKAAPGPLNDGKAKVALAGKMVMNGSIFNSQRDGDVGITEAIITLPEEQLFSEINYFFLVSFGDLPIYLLSMFTN